jgi:hypothetical protein
VDLVNKQNTWYNFSTAFFTPLGNFLVNLFAHFGFDFTDITSKERHKALLAGVDNINFVESHSVNDFLALLKFTFRALDKASLGTDVVVITAASE